MDNGLEVSSIFIQDSNGSLGQLWVMVGAVDSTLSQNADFGPTLEYQNLSIELKCVIMIRCKVILNMHREQLKYITKKVLQIVPECLA